MVGVTMVLPYAHAEETSSWNELAVKGYNIIRDCVSRPGNQRSGGTSKAGQHEGILVEIFVYQPHLHFLLDLNGSPISRVQGYVG